MTTDDSFDGPHNPTVYLSRAQMKAEEALPFTDPDAEPSRRCGNCAHFNGNYCTLEWNNLDESYKNEDRDRRDPSDDPCDDWEWDWEDEF